MPTNMKSATQPLCLRIIRALQRGPLRFNAIDRAVSAANPPHLSSRLKLLMRDGLVDRRVITLGPPAAVEYRLTALGQDLARPASALLDWTDRNADCVQQARDQHRAVVASQSS